MVNLLAGIYRLQKEKRALIKKVKFGKLTLL